MSLGNDAKCLLNNQNHSGITCFILSKCGSANLSIEMQPFSILNIYLYWK